VSARVVNVLSLLDETIRKMEDAMPTPMCNHGESGDHPVHFMARLNDLKQARAAVAELIEATGRYLKADLRVSDLKEFGGPEYAYGREWRDATVEHGNAAAALRNAHARVGGDS
jgi:hypothetical protein